MSITRRGLLNGFGALAATAVAGPALVPVSSAASARIAGQMLTGVIEDQTFVFNGTVVLRAKNLIIRRCKLLWEFPEGTTTEQPWISFDDCENVLIEDCTLQSLNDPAINYGEVLTASDLNVELNRLLGQR